MTRTMSLGALFVTLCMLGMLPEERGATVTDESPGDGVGETLTNVAQCPGGIINGSAPRTDGDFAALAELGVKTIVAVDGAYPNADRARRHGIRTVHLPVGYDGIAGGRALQLVRAARDLPQPIYIHCLHGKHRSPAVTAFVSVSLGRMTPERGVEFLQQMGTSENYPGLYDAVRSARRLDPETVNAASAEFPERTPVGGQVETMVELDRIWERMEAIRDAGWKRPPEHPDLTPASEAALLAQQIESVRAITGEDKAGTFKLMAAQAAEAARRLHESVAAERWDAAAAQMARLQQSCTACHTQYRNQ